MQTYNILLVADSPFVLKSLRNLLKKMGNLVTTVGSGEAAIEELRGNAFDLVIPSSIDALRMGADDYLLLVQESEG